MVKIFGQYLAEGVDACADLAGPDSERFDKRTKAYVRVSSGGTEVRLGGAFDPAELRLAGDWATVVCVVMPMRIGV